MRILRALWAMPVALVIAAALAVGVQASEFEGEEEGEAGAYPVTVTGSQAVTLEFIFEDGIKFFCKDVALDATLTKPSSTLTASSKYEEPCELKGGVAFKASIDFKKCDFLLHIGATNGVDSYNGTADLSCPNAEGPIIQAGTCKIEMEANQMGLGPVTFIDETNGHVSVKPEIVEDIFYVKKEDGFLCPLTGTGTKQDGSYSGTRTLFAEKGKIGIQD